LFCSQHQTFAPLNELQAGNISDDEMFRTFNMGIGMVIVVPATESDAVLSSDIGARVLGQITEGEGVELI
jgi:phosphoribosylformylglycinamidine cyclo-ligase